MKKFGMIGGTGPESTVDYYQSIIKSYQEAVGSQDELPEFLIHSVNMYKIFRLLEEEKTEELIHYLADSVRSLEQAGADFAVLAANTPHLVFEDVQLQVGIPMISIVEAAADTAEALGLKKLGLVGTKFTMENDFFKKPFKKKGMAVVVPDDRAQRYIHAKTVEELEKGIVDPETKKEFLAIASELIEREDIDGLILGCTEFPMIYKPDDLPVLLLNTTEIHVAKIVKTMIE